MPVSEDKVKTREVTKALIYDDFAGAHNLSRVISLGVSPARVPRNWTELRDFVSRVLKLLGQRVFSGETLRGCAGVRRTGLKNR